MHIQVRTHYKYEFKKFELDLCEPTSTLEIKELISEKTNWPIDCLVLKENGQTIKKERTVMSSAYFTIAVIPRSYSKTIRNRKLGCFQLKPKRLPTIKERKLSGSWRALE